MILQKKSSKNIALAGHCYNRVAEPRIRWRLLLRQELWCLFLGNPEVRRSWRFSVLTLLVASRAHQLLLSHYITHSLQRLIMRTKASPNIRVLLGFWKGPIALACHRAVLHSRQHCRTEEKERRCIGRQVAGACYVRVHNSPHVSLAKQSIASSTMVITHSRTNCWHCCMSESPEVSQFAVGTSALQSPPVSSSWSNYETITIPWHKS